MFVSGVVMWVMWQQFAVGIAGPAAESMCILADNFADDDSLFDQWCRWCEAFCNGGCSAVPWYIRL